MTKEYHLSLRFVTSDLVILLLCTYPAYISYAHLLFVFLIETIQIDDIHCERNEHIKIFYILQSFFLLLLGIITKIKINLYQLIRNIRATNDREMKTKCLKIYYIVFVEWRGARMHAPHYYYSHNHLDRVRKYLYDACCFVKIVIV